MTTAAISMGTLVVPENPRGSSFWKLEAPKSWLGMGCCDWDYDSCTLDGSRYKAQKVRTQAKEIDDHDALCRHVHAQGEWDKKVLPSGAVVCAGPEEQEYTAAFCFHCAVGASYYAVRMGQVAMKVPRPVNWIVNTVD